MLSTEHDIVYRSFCKKDETAVHGCNPALSVLVLLVSRIKSTFSHSITLAVLFVNHTTCAMPFPLEKSVHFICFPSYGDNPLNILHGKHNWAETLLTVNIK